MEKSRPPLADYAEKYGQLPPPGHIDQATAEPMGIPPQFNWRVGILSSLGMQQVYDKFDFSKTWDASENQSIGMPDVFDDGGPAGESYLRLNANPVWVFSGRGSAAPGIRLPGPAATDRARDPVGLQSTLAATGSN